jgi:hypothetical protein
LGIQPIQPHWGDESGPGWAIGGLVVIVLLVGIAMWGASLNTPQTAAVGDDATTGQSLRPPAHLMPMSAPSP